MASHDLWTLPSPLVKRTVVLCAVLALIAPASAAAHATLIGTAPADGAVLDRAPQSVRVEFDDTIHVAPGNAAVSNASNASVLAGAPRVAGHTLVLPLRNGLADGSYSVRWSIASDDGHREQGVLAFALGSGSASPQSVLGASAPLSWSNLALRALFFFGVLGAAGASVFWLLTRHVLGDRIRAPLAHLLFFTLLAAFLGASGMLHGAPPGTRFVLVIKVAVSIALVGGAAAALAPTVPILLYLAGASSLALLAAPTLAGHALDGDQPRVLAPLADAAHIASGAVWLGGLLSLVFVLPRASDEGSARAAAVRRFSSAALVSVIVLGLSGLTRALTELSAVHQLWTTSYGQTLLVKTALFVPLLGLGWLNRTFLIGAFARLRRSAFAEIALLAGVVIAVAVLTELRPGGAQRAVAAPVAVAQPATLPSTDAVVEAKELGSLVVAVARGPAAVTVTLIGPDGTGVDGRGVTVDGTPARSCGSGCYRAAAVPGGLSIGVGDQAVVFDLPARAPDATALLQRVDRAFRSARTAVFDETLASTPTNGTTTRFTLVAPDRLAYQTRGGGPSAIVIGTRRWDRDTPRAPWVPSAQTRLDVMQPYWGKPTNVHLLAPNVLTFLDRRVPAWFQVTLKGDRPTLVRMAAAGHFMIDRYVGFDVPAVVSPPPSR
ncbi:MAG: copper transport protein [Gaiellaceae bacterium]|nr:copper transport protein [Gaiellaceae bacterium]